MRIGMFVHAVWATWGRLPLIDKGIEARVHGAIAAKCRQLRCSVVAIGGMVDHVHLLAHLHPSVALARLIGQAKGYSSFMMNHVIAPDRCFRWQDRYYARPVAHDDLQTVVDYIRDQRVHHAAAHVVDDLEPPTIVS